MYCANTILHYCIVETLYIASMVRDGYSRWESWPVNEAIYQSECHDGQGLFSELTPAGMCRADPIMHYGGRLFYYLWPRSLCIFCSAPRRIPRFILTLMLLWVRSLGALKPPFRGDYARNSTSRARCGGMSIVCNYYLKD
jgi:hypothetical protein